MKNIIKSLLIIVAVAAVAGGVTYSYFFDEETSTGNTFTAGTLDLELTNGETSNAPFVIGNVVPGWEKVITYTVKNAGSVDGKLSLASADVTNTDSTGTGEFVGGGAHLGENIHIDIDTDGNGTYDLLDFSTLADQSYSGSPAFTTDLNAGITKTIHVRLYVPIEVKNEIQGDSVTGGFTVRLDQEHL
jgi:predicted ribosomally synthesized peptide with SipW-like signal peptide